jgi:hypothetical protein
LKRLNLSEWKSLCKRLNKVRRNDSLRAREFIENIGKRKNKEGYASKKKN